MNHARQPHLGRRRPARADRGRLPAERIGRPGVVPGHPARQAGARRGTGRRGQDRAGQGAVEVPRPQPRAPAVLRGARRGQGAVRVELPQAAPADPDRSRLGRLAGRAGRHLRRGLPARPAADDGDRQPRAGRAADRRDRQDRSGVRGDAARAALRLPDQHPRARADRGDHAPGGAAHLEQHPRADRGAQAPLPLPVARLPVARPRAGDRPPALAGALRDGLAQAGGDHPPDPRPRPEEAAEHRRVDRLGAGAAAAGRRGHRRRDVPRDDERDRQAPHRPRHRGGAGRREARGAERCRRRVTAGRGEFPGGKVYARVPDRRPGGMQAQLLAFAEDLREEGMSVGTSEMLDALAALGEIPWTDPEPFQAALSATIAKSPEDRRIFDLVFDRFFFRAAEAEAARQELSEGAGRERRRGRGRRLRRSMSRRSASRSPRRSRTATRPRCATSPGWRSPRSARARDPVCWESTCSGSAARSACGPSPGPSCPRTTRAATASRASSCASSRPSCAASSSAS